MAERVFHNQAYINELKQKQKVNEMAQPIIDKYYEEFRAKLKPTVQELLENPDENKIRFVIGNELAPILKSQTTNFIEKIDKAGDLKAFYKLSRDFIYRIKDFRELDSSFVYDLWIKYKYKLLSVNNKVEENEEEENAIPVVQPIHAPFGTTKSGYPRDKPGRKSKNEPKLSYIEQLKNSPQFISRQTQEVPSLNLRQGIHHHTLKKTIGKGIVGETYVARR